MNATRSRRSARALATAATLVAMIAGALALAGASTALGQDAEDCDVVDLGALGNEAGSVLEAEGRWTTEDCDSRFRPGSDAHTYRFDVAEAGRIRIGLSSADADSYLYLLAEDGSRITGNDDNGERLDARVERDLAPGTYLVEATTVGGRGRGPADFTLTVSRVEGCDFVHLGTLQAGADLTATGTWSLDTCGSRFVSRHPAHAYTFNLPEAGRVRIDLESENGDPVLSLASLAGGIVSADDDSGDRRNSLIREYLPAGVYFIEATTYYARDFQPLQAEFTLTVHLVDELGKQQDATLKVEEVQTPAEVVAGDPFTVHYRVGNVGGGALPDDGSHARIWLGGYGGFDRISRLTGIWDAGVAYHTGDGTASATSTTIDEIAAFEATVDDHGPSWVFVGVVADDADGNEIGWHGLWHNLLVLSGPTFGPVTVSVDGAAYTVTAEADAEGKVTTTVSEAADPEAEVHQDVEAKAVYAAGVRTQLLDGIFERPGIVELSTMAQPDPVSVSDPSSSTLLKALGERFAHAGGVAELQAARARGEAVNPVTVEESVLATSQAAQSQYATMAASWTSLLDRLDAGEPLSFDEALTTHAQLAYAERLISPAVTAGEIVVAARAADEGWDDEAVEAMMEDHQNCSPEPGALRGALKAAGASNVDELVALDADMRVARGVHGLAIDGALCASAAADDANSRFLRRLSISSNIELRRLLEPVTASLAPDSHQLRIIARIGDDGRVEHGVELDSGRRVLPLERFLPADAPTGRWQLSAEVRVWPDPIGRIRSRHLADGRIEMGFIGADGDRITPGVAYLSAGAPTGVWFYSSEITVPAASVMGRSG
ncbi:MAG: PPC domain-containing protein [Acidimicrobiaceae bacterium]|nr:PPC domain-containing protein [Acidimicrobiaceae bacterium]